VSPRAARRGAAAALLAALAACATAPPRPAPDLAGRLAVHVEAHDGVEARSMAAQFELRGDARSGELQLSTPLGSTAAHARWRPGAAELTTADGTRRFADLDALAEALLGQALPLAALTEWLRGRSWTGAPSVARDGGFEQLGWRIDLSRFDQGWVLAARDANPAIAVRARVERPE
jgi:outer membrane lipoprotein LolB